MLSRDSGEFLLALAREVVEKTAWNEEFEKPEKYPEELDKKRGVFCTLHKIQQGKKELRGCIGLPYSTKPLIDAVIEAAHSSCFDSRFPELKHDELKNIEIEISVLTEPVETLADEIRENMDGVIVKKGNHSALYLPQVWEYYDSRGEFLSSLCMKAGLPPNAWKEGAKLYTFKAEVFNE